MTVNRSKTSPNLMGRLTVGIAYSMWKLSPHMVLALFLTSHPAFSGTLLPNGMQYFADENGQPLAAACVYFYVPGTTSPKATYQNAAQTVANTNPVQLDAAGRAIIYGTGTYRQVVKKAGPNPGLPCSPAGVQIWDQLTASTDSSSTIFAGASAGTPNAITVNAPAFSGADGQVINYISTNTNTGGATFNPSGFGAVQIVRDSATGPSALTGGELVATNAVSLIYDATAGTFHILSPVTWPNTSGVPVGSVIPVGGFNAPTNYAFAYGQAVSRTAFSSLLSAYTSAQTASLSSGSPTITGLSDTSQFAKGQAIEAVGIPAGATIQSCTSTTCALSANATATRSGTVTVFAYGNGDGSTTFNLPDYRGRGLVGRDNMGGSAGNIIQVTANLSTTNLSTSATVSSASGLAVGMTLSGNVNVPAGATITAISGTTLTLSVAATATQSTVATRFSVFPDAQGLGLAGGSPVQTLIAAQLPSITSTNASQSISVGPGLSHVPFSPTNYANVALVNTAGSVNIPFSASSSGDLTGTSAFSGTNSITVTSTGTSGAPHPIVMPSTIVNYAVRLTP